MLPFASSAWLWLCLDWGKIGVFILFYHTGLWFSADLAASLLNGRAGKSSRGSRHRVLCLALARCSVKLVGWLDGE